MYYKFTEFYKRDVNFVYSLEKNPVNWLKLREGNSFKFDHPLRYDVDKIDTYINSYDLLPTIGPSLVSKKFYDLFEALIDKEIQLFAATIYDKKGNINNDFLVLNILNVLPCLDKERAVFEVDEDDYYSIKKLYVTPNALLNYSIVRMKEQKSYILVTEEFKKRCEEANLKGIDFIEEGYSIYKTNKNF